MSLSLPTYPDSVQFLYSLANESRTLKLGLERMSTLLDHLGNPHNKCRFVHVAEGLLQLVQSDDQRATLATKFFYYFSGQFQGEIPERGRTYELHHESALRRIGGTLEFLFCPG